MTNYFINEKVLIQLELNQKNGENVYEIITFFRHTHDIHIMPVGKTYKKAKEKYNTLCNKCLD